MLVAEISVLAPVQYVDSRECRNLCEYFEVPSMQQLGRHDLCSLQRIRHPSRCQGRKSLRIKTFT